MVNFKKHSRLVMDFSDALKIPPEHRPMFRRLAAKGLHDKSIKDLIANPAHTPPASKDPG